MNNITLFFFFLLLGLVFGSFFNVVGLRTPLKQAFSRDRSRCPHCEHVLLWYELIPVVSYLLLQGKCRYCRDGISPLYPVVEILTGILFAFSFFITGFHLELIISLLLVSMLVIIIVSDLTYMCIPDGVLLFFLPLFIAMRFMQPFDPWWSPFAGGLGVLLLIAAIILISRGGMGGGDMKLFGMLGIVLGIKKVMLAFFLACLFGGVIGMALLWFKIVQRGQAVPFGPYIVTAALVSYFYGDPLVGWYAGLF